MALGGVASKGVQRAHGTIMTVWVGMHTLIKCDLTPLKRKQIEKQDNNKAKLVYRHSMNTIHPSR
jgi:hypothetical protein